MSGSPLCILGKNKTKLYLLCAVLGNSFSPLFTPELCQCSSVRTYSFSPELSIYTNLLPLPSTPFWSFWMKLAYGYGADKDTKPLQEWEDVCRPSGEFCLLILGEPLTCCVFSGSGGVSPHLLYFSHPSPPTPAGMEVRYPPSFTKWVLSELSLPGELNPFHRLCC